MYKLANQNAVIRLEDGMFISLPAGETEGFKYQEWLNIGNTPLPMDPPSPQPLNSLLFGEIAALELRQQRAVREFILGDTTAQSRIKTIDDQIKALRSQLV